MRRYPRDGMQAAGRGGVKFCKEPEQTGQGMRDRSRRPRLSGIQ